MRISELCEVTKKALCLPPGDVALFDGSKLLRHDLTLADYNVSSDEIFACPDVAGSDEAAAVARAAANRVDAEPATAKAATPSAHASGVQSLDEAMRGALKLWDGEY